MFQTPGVQGGGIGARGRAGAAADHGRDAGGKGVLDLLWADEMDVPVDAARRDDAAFRRDDLGRRANRHAWRDAALHEWVARVADGGDPAVFDPDVCFDDALHGVEDEGVRQNEVERFGVEGER